MIRQKEQYTLEERSETLVTEDSGLDKRLNTCGVVETAKKSR